MILLPLEWSFSPADTPLYHRAAKILVKCKKRALNAAIGEQTLSVGELQTVMFEADQLFNQRPIGMHSKTPDDGT